MEPEPMAPHARTAGARPAAQRVHELVAMQAARTPARSAVIAPDGSLTYAELERRANLLAGYLRAVGVGSDDLVAVAMEPSRHLVIALLGIWKAGAAYLPLNPADPPTRISAVVAEARSALLLTCGATDPGVRDLPVTRLALDTADARRVLNRYPPCAPRTPGGERSLAYVIYTSGSTGRPKGVAIEHRSLRHYLLNALDHYAGVSASSLVHSPVSFDLTVTGLYGPLLTGGQVELASRLGGGGGSRPGFVKCTPAHLPLLGSISADHCPEQTLVIGGEQLLWEQLAGWRRAHPAVAVHNEYGPTEATVGCCVRCITPAEKPGSGAVPIGQPLPGTRLHVLDSRLRRCPPGAVGELYIGGECLARGYLHDAAGTAARFVADPFGPPGARMYRTGDLAAVRADGDLEFRGRCDDQVSVRGHRVELGEISAVLAAHPGVTTASARAEAVGSGDRRIVAFAVGRPGRVPSADELTAWLADRLPAYMVPNSVTFLDNLPLTPHGKVDREALPTVRPRQAAERTSQEAGPGGRTELLCSLFARILRVDEAIGPDDNFFALGGSSMSAVQLVMRIREVFGCTLSADDIFRHRTPRRIALQLSPGRPDPAPALRAAPPGASAALSHVQRRLWYLSQLHETTAPYHMWRLSRLRGRLDVRALRFALHDVLARHEALRTTVRAHRGVPRPQVLPPPADGRLAVTASGPDELAAALRPVLDAPFDLAAEPPFRAHLLRLGEDHHVLALVVHHGAADADSLAVLRDDLTTAYTARSRGTAPRWAPLPLRYCDFAHWEQELTASDALTTEVRHWARVLAGAPAESLPQVDHPRPGDTAPPPGGSVRLHVPETYRIRLARFASRAGMTPFMAGHAGLLLALRAAGAPQDMVVGTAAGRLDARLAHTVGCFVNTLPLRTDLGGNPTFVEFLERVCNTDLAAFAHRRVPFDHLVDRVAHDRAPGRHPFFQVMFGFTETPMDPFSPPGVAASSLHAEARTAKFDLSVEIGQSRSPEGHRDGLTCTVEYHTGLFERSTAAAIAHRLERVLRLLPGVDPGTSTEDLTAALRDDPDQLDDAASGNPAMRSH